MAKTLAERLRLHAQMKAKLAAAEARLKLDERKQRTRRLVEAGAMVEKIGLLNLEGATLYGALLSLQDGISIPKQVKEWAALGARILAQESPAHDADKEPMLLTFTAPLSKEITISLRKAGFRYSSVLQHWEGLARFDEASAIAQTHGGSARRVEWTNKAVPENRPKLKASV